MSPPLYAVVPAAGTGQRMEAQLPKQYLTLRGRTLAEHTMARLLAMGSLRQVVVAVADGDPWWPRLDCASHPRVRTVTGGASRAESVLRGLETLAGEAPDEARVLVHDMARPCVRLSDMERLASECGARGALLARPVHDTLKQSDDSGHVIASPDRRHVWRALTPQCFPLDALREALREALAAGLEVTDEASAMEHQGWHPLLVAGHADNLKVTEPADLALAAFHMEQQEREGLHWRNFA